MDCETCHAAINTWFSQQLLLGSQRDTPLDDEVLEHISHCHSCSVHFAIANQALGKTDYEMIVPTDAAQRITQTVMNKTRTQHRFAIRKIALIAAAAVLMILPFARERTVFSQSDVQQITLTLEAPEAETVVVAGDWNGWDTEVHRLAKHNQRGVWEIELQLKKGTDYRYQFIIDGTDWIADPNAYLTVADGFGGVNSVLEL